MDLVAEPGSALQDSSPSGLLARMVERHIGRFVDNGRLITGPAGRQLLATCLTRSFPLPHPVLKHLRETVVAENDVKIVGTNSISHLDSIKAEKTNAKRTPK